MKEFLFEFQYVSKVFCINDCFSGFLGEKYDPNDRYCRSDLPPAPIYCFPPFNPLKGGKQEELVDYEMMKSKICME